MACRLPSLIGVGCRGVGRAARPAAPGSAGAAANRASCRSSSARSAAGQVALASAARGGSRPGRRPTRDGGRRSTTRSPSGRRRGEASSAATGCGSSPPPSIWSSAISAARRTRGSSLCRPGRGRLRDRRSRSGRRSASVPGRGRPRLAERPRAARARPTCRRSARAPRRRRGGSGATGLAAAAISAATASRSRQRLAEWIAAWRTVSSGSARAVADDRARPRRRRSASRPRRRSAAPRPSGPASSTLAASDGHRSPPRPARVCDRPLAHRRPRVVEQAGELVGRHRRPGELQPARVVDLAARPCGGRGRSPPSTSGLWSCDVGQQSLYQPPVSTTSRLPSASSSTSVGWKSRLLETRKSSSLRRERRAVGRRGRAGVTLCRLN